MMSPTAAANQALAAQKARLTDAVASAVSKGSNSVFAGIQNTGTPTTLADWVKSFGYNYNPNTDVISW